MNVIVRASFEIDLVPVTAPDGPVTVTCAELSVTFSSNVPDTVVFSATEPALVTGEFAFWIGARVSGPGSVAHTTSTQ